MIRSSDPKIAVMVGGFLLASCTAYDSGPSAYYLSEGTYSGYPYPPYGFPMYGYPAYGPGFGFWSGEGWQDRDRWRRERSDDRDRDHRASRQETPGSHSDSRRQQAAPQARAAPHIHQTTPQASAMAPNHAVQRSHHEAGRDEPRGGGWRDQRQPH